MNAHETEIGLEIKSGGKTSSRTAEVPDFHEAWNGAQFPDVFGLLRFW